MESLGHIIVERNWRHAHLELDIISLEGSYLHIVEVKSLSAPAVFAPEIKVDMRKQKRIISAALAFLNSPGRKKLPSDLEVYFDVITLLFDGADFDLNYYPQAFIPRYA